MMTVSMIQRIKTIVLVLMTSVLGACAQSADSIRSVDATAFERAIQADSVQVVDVRTADEYAAGHIAHAVNIDVLQLAFMDSARRLDRHREVYVYCRSGKRSMAAARQLAAAGYRVVNLRGGIIEWAAAGKSVVK